MKMERDSHGLPNTVKFLSFSTTVRKQENDINGLRSELSMCKVEFRQRRTDGRTGTNIYMVSVAVAGQTSKASGKASVKL